MDTKWISDKMKKHFMQNRALDMNIENYSALSLEDKDRITQKAEADLRYFKAIITDLQRYGKIVERMSLLDIGCGKTFPMPLLFSTFGCSDAVGIDIDAFARLDNLGLEEKYYYLKLQEFAGRRLAFKRVNVKKINIADTRFPDSFFDIVISNVAFEHIDNLPDAAIEINRILKPGGIIRIGVHQFTSLSGSHHPLLQKEPLQALPPGIEPWYHLRGLPGIVNVTLNKWRQNQYRELFKKNFDISEWRLSELENGKEFLTDEIRKELKEYSDDELLRSCFTVIARKS